MQKVIINKNEQFGTLDGTITPTSVLYQLVFAALKNGKAKLIIDNEETLMYEIQAD